MDAGTMRRGSASCRRLSNLRERGSTPSTGRTTVVRILPLPFVLDEIVALLISNSLAVGDYELGVEEIRDGRPASRAT